MYKGALPDGNFRATLPAGSVTDLAGIPTASDAVVNFFFMQADANRDGRVNLEDFSILAANLGQSDRFSQADFNCDRRVDLNDFNILAGRFGLTLAAPSASPFGSFGEDRTSEDGSSEESLM